MLVNRTDLSLTPVTWMPLLIVKLNQVNVCVQYDIPFLSLFKKDVLTLICIEVLLAGKGVFVCVPPPPLVVLSLNGYDINVIKTLIKSGTVSCTHRCVALLKAAHLQKQVRLLPVLTNEQPCS